MWVCRGKYPVAGRIICAQSMCFVAKTALARQVVISTLQGAGSCPRQQEARQTMRMTSLLIAKT